MTPQNEQVLIAELDRDEGREASPYLDSMGIKTVATGHNMIAHPLPADWTFPLSDAQMDQLLAQDLQSTYADLNRNITWWKQLDDVRQRVLCNMCFNMGVNRLLGFRLFLAAAARGDWNDAADEMLDSKWARDVGVGTAQKPGRALRLANMMRFGVAK
jgi:lysozyme